MRLSAQRPPIHDGTAAHYVSREVPIASVDDRAGEVRGALMGRRFERTGDVAILAGTQLVGLVQMEDLLAAPSR